MLLTEQCHECNRIVISRRFGCRACYEDGKPEGTFCSADCVDVHKSKTHNVNETIERTRPK